MQKTYLMMSLILAFFLSGCASKYEVTFDSNPRGAILVCNGINWGYTPTTLYYDEQVKENSSLNLGSCSANWISGATESYGKIDLNRFPDGVRQTLQRPKVAGYDKDIQFALQVESVNYQKRQAKAAESANFQNSINQINNNVQLQQINNNLNGIRYGY